MKRISFLIIMIMGLFVLSTTNTNGDLGEVNIPTPKPIVKVSTVDTFTIEKFKELLITLNVKYPDIVFAQAKIESGNFNSKIFRENHNLFGMKEARQRAHTAIGTRYNHAVYSDWRQSVLDYTIYQSCYLRKFNRSEYIDYLGRNYAQDKNYVTKVVAIAKQSKKYFS